MRIPAAAVIHLSSILAPFSGVMVEEASVDDDFRRIEEATSGEEAEVVAMMSLWNSQSRTGLSSDKPSGSISNTRSMPPHDDDDDDNDDSARLASLKRPRHNAGKEPEADRQQRCRERNRIHARKTRQRKKAQIESLKRMADRLKEQQLRLVHAIHEKQTANILLSIYGGCSSTEETPVTPKETTSALEQLLARSTEEIPDANCVPDLPAFDMPGHLSKSLEVTMDVKTDDNGPIQDKETVERIRRERNRLHAKRTRDRKRLFVQEMDTVCRQLEEENELLQNYLQDIDPNHPELDKAQALSMEFQNERRDAAKADADAPPMVSPLQKPQKIDERSPTKTLLDAAAMFLEREQTSPVSPDHSIAEEEEDDAPRKRKRHS